MKNLSFYEQVGIVTPGALFLFGLLFIIPDLRDVLAKDGISVGGLGVFILVSYATGHLLAAGGNCIEALHWRLNGGMPSNWIVGPKPCILSAAQIGKVHAQVTSRLHLDIPPLAEMTVGTWFPIFRQIYSDVERHGKPSRGDAFNGMYGLNRGLCAATLALSVAFAIADRSHWTIALCLLATAAVYLYRMHRFGVHYAREIYNQFLLLPPQSQERAEARSKAAKSSPA